MRFPQRLRHNGKGKALATIYKRADCYRLYWRCRVDGKPVSRSKDFALYSEAAGEGATLVKQLARADKAATFSPGQASDAQAALERLQRHFTATGQRVSLLASASEFCEASALLHGQSICGAVRAYLATVASVTRKDVAEAVEELIASEQPRTVAIEGQRAQVSMKYAYNGAIMLRRFASAFPATAVCDLGRQHLDAFIASLATVSGKQGPVKSAKARNHYRAVVRHFLTWAVRKDYLQPNHRLNEADKMRPEHANTAEVQIYTPTQFRALLEAAQGPSRAMIAIGGLAGLRTQELLRLDWADLWRVAGHIEVTAQKAKTRQRRLVPICPALAAWLRPFRQFAQGPVCLLSEGNWQKHVGKLCDAAGVAARTTACATPFAVTPLRFMARYRPPNKLATPPGCCTPTTRAWPQPKRPGLGSLCDLPRARAT